MATRKGTIQLTREDLAVTARFETERLEAHDIEEGPEIARWDSETDQPVVRQSYVKETHEEIADQPSLPKGTTGYRWVNEDGEEVPKERLTYVQLKPDGEVESVEKRASTVLTGEVVPVEKWVDSDVVERFLFDSTYEVWGQEAEDEAELQKLAEYIEEASESPMFVWMLQPEFFKTWGILLPQFDEENDEFSLFVKTTRKRLEPKHEMPIMTAAEIEEARTASEENFVEQEVPG